MSPWTYKRLGAEIQLIFCSAVTSLSCGYGDLLHVRAVFEKSLSKWSSRCVFGSLGIAVLTCVVAMSVVGSNTTYGIKLPYPEILQFHGMCIKWNCDFIIFKGCGTLYMGVRMEALFVEIAERGGKRHFKSVRTSRNNFAATTFTQRPWVSTNNLTPSLFYTHGVISTRPQATVW